MGNKASKSQGAEFTQTVLDWYSKHGRKLSFRRFSEPYHVLIAEIMLRKTTARQVDKVFTEFIKKFPTIQILASANISEIEKIIRPLGIKSRAKHLLHLAKVIVREKGGIIPTAYDELRKLPGVGDYIAGCVAVFCFGKRIPLIDTNIERVLARIFNLEELPSSKRKEIIKEKYLCLAPEERGREFHYGLLDISALFCRPRNPRCSNCPIGAFCNGRNKYLQISRGNDSIKQYKRGNVEN